MKSKLQEIYETSTRLLERDRVEAMRQGDLETVINQVTNDYMDNYELTNFFGVEDNKDD